LRFNYIELAPNASLCFYDGETINAPLLTCITSANPPVANWTISPSLSNTSRAITIKFENRTTQTGRGWDAFITCTTPCQPFTGSIYETIPAADTAGFINVCAGQPIIMKARGNYPSSGLIYGQRDSTSFFSWIFRDNTPATGATISKTFQNSGYYTARLTINDSTRGCLNTNTITKQIKVLPAPTLAYQNNPVTLCLGDTLSLQAKYLTNNEPCTNATLCIQKADTLRWNTFQRITPDSLCIPDGGGSTLTSKIFFSGFSDSARLTNINQLDYVNINIEHTYLFDNDIRLVCPNGQSIALHKFITQRGPEVFLGNADDGITVTTGCPVFQGYGWDYRWSPSATKTWTQTVDAVPTGTVSMNIGAPAGVRRVLPPSVRPINPNTSLPDRRTSWVNFLGTLSDYKPDEDWSNLIGCPLNGEWSLLFRDLFGIDDGRLFSWDIKFNQSLTDTNRLRTLIVPPPAVVERGWLNHQNAVFRNQDTIKIRPVQAGNTTAFYQIRDALGCQYQYPVPISTRERWELSNAALNTATDSVFSGQIFTITTTLRGDSGRNVTYRWFRNDTLMANQSRATLSTQIQQNTAFRSEAISLDSLCAAVPRIGTEPIIMKVRRPNAVGEVSMKDNWQIYPNPLQKGADLILNMQDITNLPANDVTIEWWTLDGKQINVQKYPIVAPIIQIKSDFILGGGVFLMKIKVGNQNWFKKIVIL
jgi:subtilisin-like proprotein convertase family protein